MNNPLTALLAPKNSHSFVFAYQFLPEKLWNEDSVLGRLADPHDRDTLIDIWNEIPSKVKLERDRSHIGLDHSAYWIGDEHLVIAIELPTPAHSHDPMYIVIATSPELRYFVFEFGKSEQDTTCAYFCERMPDDERRTLGQYPLVDETLALKLVCRELGCAESVEEPLPVQLTGAEARKALAHCEPISPKDATLANDLEMRAHAAAKNSDSLEQAQQLYRKLIDFRQSLHSLDTKEVPSCYSRLVNVLRRQGKLGEAEAVAREAWKFCRRHRELGHPDTVAAIRQLADCLRSIDREDESISLHRYGSQLIAMTRGKAASDTAAIDFLESARQQAVATRVKEHV